MFLPLITDTWGPPADSCPDSIAIHLSRPSHTVACLAAYLLLVVSGPNIFGLIAASIQRNFKSPGGKAHGHLTPLSWMNKLEKAFCGKKQPLMRWKNPHLGISQFGFLPLFWVLGYAYHQLNEWFSSGKCPHPPASQSAYWLAAGFRWNVLDPSESLQSFPRDIDSELDFFTQDYDA
ncbi:Semaphorin-4F [Manis pentadactyla]|nr:Semaphorin-4F [Manis pentadactyla]